MKKTAALLMCLVLLLSFPGCGAEGKTDTVPGDAAGQEVPAEKEMSPGRKSSSGAAESSGAPSLSGERETLGELLEGVYERDVEGEEELSMRELIEISPIGGMLMLEHSLVIGNNRELYDTWAEEFWPDFPGMLNDFQQSIRGKSQCYSMMGMAGNFQDLPEESVLSLADGTLTVTDSWGGVTRYERSSEPGIHHTPQEMAEHMNGRRVSIPQIEGEWLCQDGAETAWLRFSPDGSFRYASKKPGETSQVFEGCWGYDDERETLELSSEQAGWGAMPRQSSLIWSVDEGGNLTLQLADGFEMSPLQYEELFMPSEGEFSMNPYNCVPFGYTQDYYNVKGEYTDSSGITRPWSYHLPWVLGSTPDISDLNAAVEREFAAPVEEALGAIDAGLDPWITSAEFESAVHENLLFVTVWAENDTDYTHYMSWCCDLRQERLIDTPEILRQLGIPEEDFIRDMKAAAEDFYTEANDSLPEAVKQTEDYQDRLRWTLSDENINTGLMVFMDPLGNLAAVTPIASNAGADWYEHIIYPYSPSLSR